MLIKNSLTTRIWILILLFFGLLACEAPNVVTNLIRQDKDTANDSKGPTMAPTITTLVTARVKATETQGWVDTRVIFQESDCPSGGLPKPTAYVNPGSLTCNYSIEGGSEGMSIRQVNDTKDLQDQFSSSKDYSQQQISTFLTKPNAQLSQLSNDPKDNLYMITYDGVNPMDDTQIPLCVYAGGNKIVNDAFITGFLLTACSQEKSSDDYRNEFQSLVDSAMKAIERVEGT